MNRRLELSELQVFVYGTLRRGGFSEHLMHGSTWERSAKTAPHYTLWQLSWYPGMTSGGDTSIAGDVYTVPADRLAELDDYEGDSYRRVNVALEDGSIAIAWVLRYPPQGKPIIANGDWIHYLRQIGPCQSPSFSGMVSSHEHAGL